MQSRGPHARLTPLKYITPHYLCHLSDPQMHVIKRLVARILCKSVDLCYRFSSTARYL